LYGYNSGLERVIKAGRPKVVHSTTPTECSHETSRLDIVKWTRTEA
jgi:hypothetical protein